MGYFDRNGMLPHSIVTYLYPACSIAAGQPPVLESGWCWTEHPTELLLL